MVIGARVGVVAGLLGEAGTGGDIDLAADDRLDPGGPALHVELHGAEHVAVVGDRHRRHPVLSGLGDQIVEADGAVEKGILGMEMKMDEIGLCMVPI